MHAGSLESTIEKYDRVARGAAESNSSFLSAIQTSQLLAQLKHEHALKDENK